MLEFKYELIQGQRLERARGSAPLMYEDGSIGFDTVHLALDKCSLLFSIDSDTDELLISVEEANDAGRFCSWVDINALKDLLNREVGWLWRARNWMGYADMAALSFSGIEPNIAIVGMASKLNLYRIDRLIG